MIKNRILAVPILPGKTETWVEHCRIMMEERKEEFTDFARRNGVSESRMWLQRTPQGDMVIVLHEGQDPDKFHDAAVRSDEPIAAFLRESILEVHGVDVRTVDTGPAPSLELNLNHVR